MKRDKRRTHRSLSFDASSTRSVRSLSFFGLPEARPVRFDANNRFQCVLSSYGTIVLFVASTLSPRLSSSTTSVVIGRNASLITRVPLYTYVSTDSFTVPRRPYILSVFLFTLETLTTRITCVLPVRTAQRDRRVKIVDLKPLLIQETFRSLIDSMLQLDTKKSVKQFHN